jgi:uncharacterized UPF0160 family protein
MKVIVHGGKFHADDVMACAIISHLTNVVIERRNPTENELNDSSILVLDCGRTYEPLLNNFDHHQGTFEEKRKNGIPYATTGLIWKHYGYQLLDSKFVWEFVDKNLMSDIDARDVGYETVYCPTSFSNCINYFNPSSEASDFDSRFFKALEFAREILRNNIRHGRDEEKSMNVLLNSEIIEKSILLLEKYVPWLNVIHMHPNIDDLLYVVYPSSRGSYSIQQIPIEPNSMIGKKPLPKKWRGLSDLDLAKEVGIEMKTCFCHINGFIGASEKKEDALAMAKIAVNS